MNKTTCSFNMGLKYTEANEHLIRKLKSQSQAATLISRYGNAPVQSTDNMCYYHKITVTTLLVISRY